MTRSRPRRATVAWCLFDFANSAYTTLIITVAFAVYFRQVVVNAPDNRGDQLWGIANFVAMLAVAAASPILGAIADYSASKKKFMGFFALMGIVASLFMVTIGRGGWLWAVVLYLFGRVGFSGANIFYDSLLPHVARENEMDKVSSAGYALGYLGGGLLLAGLLLLLCRRRGRGAGL